MPVVTREASIYCPNCRHRELVPEHVVKTLESPESRARFALTVPPCPNCRSRTRQVETKTEHLPDNIIRHDPSMAGKIVK